MANLSPLLLLLVAIISVVQGKGFQFAVLSDLHIGESSEADSITLEAINTVNEVAHRFNLSFVIITGDITSSALPSQYEQARSMLDTLVIPYYPIFGNHDVWVYVRPTNETSWEEKVPTGDALFAKYFEDIFIRDNITYNFDTVWNPEQQINSTFLNWEMRFPSEDGTFVLYGLDFVTREAATNPKDLYKGGAPTASLHNFPNGTLDWLSRRLDLLPKDTVSVVTAHHHTVVTTPFFTPDYFSMNEDDRVDLRCVLTRNGRREEMFWGALVGHMHFWDDQTALFGTYRQWETTAAKQDGSNAIAIAQVDNGTIVSIQRCCGTSESFETLKLAKKTVTGAFLFLASICILHFAYSLKLLICRVPLFIISFVILSVSQVLPLIGGNSFVTKHINVNYMGPIMIGIVFVYGILKNKFSRNSIFAIILLIVGSILMDVTRYPIRTSWLEDGDNFNVLFVYLSLVLIIATSYKLFSGRAQYKWTLPLLLSLQLGILIELIGCFISSLLFRMLSPITLQFYTSLEYFTVFSLIGIMVGQIITAGLIAKRFNILYCISIASVMQTISNAFSQLVLRSNSYPIPYVYFIVFLSFIILSVGIITFTKDERDNNNKNNNNNRNTNEVKGNIYVLLDKI